MRGSLGKGVREGKKNREGGRERRETRGNYHALLIALIMAITGPIQAKYNNGDTECWRYISGVLSW